MPPLLDRVPPTPACPEFPRSSKLRGVLIEEQL